MCIGFSFSLTRRTRILIRPQTQDFHRQHECVTLAGVCTRIGHEPRTQKKRTNKKKNAQTHTHTHTQKRKKKQPERQQKKTNQFGLKTENKHCSQGRKTDNRHKKKIIKKQNKTKSESIQDTENKINLSCGNVKSRRSQ